MHGALLNRLAAKSELSRLNREDIDRRADIEKADNGDVDSSGSDNDLEHSATSDKIVLSFEEDDPENPYSWSLVGYMLWQCRSWLMASSSRSRSCYLSRSSAS